MVTDFIRYVFNYKKYKKYGAIEENRGPMWNTNALIVVNLLRQRLLRYAKDVHGRKPEPEYTRDMIYGQQMTCYGVLDELDKLLAEAYESKVSFAALQNDEPVRVVDLMYALGSRDKDEYITLLVEGSQPVRLNGVFADENGHLILTGSQKGI